MPELPEVETIAAKLRPLLVGKRIAGMWISGRKLRRPMQPDLVSQLLGKSILRIDRRGKYLVIQLEPPLLWLIHLGMSGRLRYHESPSPPPGHTHAVVRFSGGGELQYSDPRRFGLLFVHAADNPEALSEMLRLGEDPLGDGFVAAWLKSELARSRREIKAFLLDQEKIAGLGNIYACEALFRARLYPCRRCHTLDSREASALRRAIVAVLKAAIRNHGTSFSDFIDADGEPGSHQNFLRVFQREGERCRRCRAVIRRMKQANRSTYYCPGCQRRSQAPKRKGG